MNLTPTELERLTIFTAAELARRYRLNFGVPEDVAFAEMRVRPQTMAAEDMLR